MGKNKLAKAMVLVTKARTTTVSTPQDQVLTLDAKLQVYSFIL